MNVGCDVVETSKIDSIFFSDNRVIDTIVNVIVTNRDVIFNDSENRKTTVVENVFDQELIQNREVGKTNFTSKVINSVIEDYQEVIKIIKVDKISVNRVKHFFNPEKAIFVEKGDRSV